MVVSFLTENICFIYHHCFYSCVCLCTHTQWCAYGSFRGQLPGFWLCPSTLSRTSFFCCFCQSLYSTLAGRLLSNPLVSVSYLAVNLLELQAHTTVFSFMWVPRTELRSLGLCGKCVYPLSHLTDSIFNFLRDMYANFPQWLH